MTRARSIVKWSAAAGVALVLATGNPAHADPLGAGTFTIDVDLTNGQMSGTISFNNEVRNFFGTNVNLGTSVGTLVVGPVSELGPQLPTKPRSGKFIIHASSAGGDSLLQGDDEDFLSYYLGYVAAGKNLGTYVCASAGCTAGAADSFILPSPVLSGPFFNALGVPAYTGDGSAICCVGAACAPPVAATDEHCTGTFAINGFAPVNTPVSNNPLPLSLSGTFYNTLTNVVEARSVDVTFTKVTQLGQTTLTVMSNQNGTMPLNFRISLPGFQPIYFDVSTTATYTGTVKVCLHYLDDGNGHLAGTTIPESQLALVHKVSDVWDADTLSTVDTVNNVVCATVTTLSPFALAVRNLGLIPPTAASLKCEEGVAKNVGKLASAIIKCQMRAAAAAFKQASIDEGGCEASARVKYDEKNAKLAGCPQCLLDAEGMVADSISSGVAAVPTQTYCDGTTSIPLQ